MSEKELASSIDAALAHVDPDRRKFLGILLAGVAAAPLLTSASLAAEDKHGAQKTEAFPKNATTVKGNTAIKDGSSNTIKLNEQKTQIKGENSTIKLQPNAIKGANNTIKLQPNAIKIPNNTIKLQPNAIKGENSTIKGQNSTIKSGSTPAPQ